MVYMKVLLDDIENEKKGGYGYTDSDRKILEQLLAEINTLSNMDFQYLAELNALDIKGTGEIIRHYITRFETETIRAVLATQMVSDKIKDCDKEILQLYLHFKKSEEYISAEGTPSPAHIHVVYDNALRKLKPKRLEKELIKLAYNPRDVFYLPFTMRMIASWKIPKLEKLWLAYLEGSSITSESVGLKSEIGNYYPSLDYIKRDLKFTALEALKYYSTEENLKVIKDYVKSDDKDIRIAAQKTIKALEKVVIYN